MKITKPRISNNLSKVIVNLSSMYAIPSSSTIIAPIFVELAFNSWLLLHNLASITAIISALDAFIGLVYQLEFSNILFLLMLLLRKQYALTQVQAS
jgi:hypothetical protein